MKKELLIELIKEIICDDNAASNESNNGSPVKIGESYLFRTVTHIEVGRVKSICGQFVTLEDASWIADTGRYHDCLSKGEFSEIEPYPLTTTLNLNSLINLAPWPHSLPKEQK